MDGEVYYREKVAADRERRKIKSVGDLRRHENIVVVLISMLLNARMAGQLVIPHAMYVALELSLGGLSNRSMDRLANLGLVPSSTTTTAMVKSVATVAILQRKAQFRAFRDTPVVVDGRVGRVVAIMFDNLVAVQFRKVKAIQEKFSRMTASCSVMYKRLCSDYLQRPESEAPAPVMHTINATTCAAAIVVLREPFSTLEANSEYIG